MSPKSKANYIYNSFESLALSIIDANWKNQKPVLFIVVYRPPGPYSQFLLDFSDFLSSILLSWDRIIIVGDFNIHVDDEGDSLGKAFNDLLDGTGFIQNVNKPTHSHKHTLDLILTYGTEISDLSVHPHNPVLSDHFLITFQFVLQDNPPLVTRTQMKRTLGDHSVSEYKQIIQPIFASMSSNYEGVMSGLAVNDEFVDRVLFTFRTTLDVVAPSKLKFVKPRRASPWYNAETRSLKQSTRKLERLWRRSNTEHTLSAWKHSLVTYKQALRTAKTRYYSSLIEENKNNPRFLFSTVARLTNSHTSIEPYIPTTLSCDDFLKIFNNKIATIRNKINESLPIIRSDKVQTKNSESPINPSKILNNFTTVDQIDVTSIIMSSKPSMCLLDPIPTKLFKETLPLTIDTILNIINTSLVTGYVPQSFKYAVIKPLLKKPTLDPDILANYDLFLTYHSSPKSLKEW
ncbi:uncharacterized protein LOC130928554 [Corythoichthys intestinalis]|uniref:uncharacterized protein LOC130928554 n=1 Tax=Corythoichthys intestinalis TaxID=161448 RepID=UPI0025A57ACD|nr:uncharacterized protein LOC130928554 [Corythoichthys intestinalis]